MYIVYIRERYYFSLVLNFFKAINSVKVIDIQKGALGIKEKIDNRFSSSYNSCFYPLMSYSNSDYPQ